MTIKRISLLILASTFALQASAANIVINVLDGAGEGFNDPSQPLDANQIGATNTVNTLGDLRLEVFEEAAKVWGATLNSAITITIGAEFNDLLCEVASARLGQAGPTATAQGFAGADPGIAYAIALAESLSNSNQNDLHYEIHAEFNKKLDIGDPTCMSGKGFYYGLDDNVPAGMSALFPVVLHELAHGLGFLSYVDPATGKWNTGYIGQPATNNPDAYSRHLKDLQTNKSWLDMNDAERVASALNEPNLVWTGAKVTADRALHLDPTTELRINAPVAGTFDANLGQQSTAIPSGGLTAAVVDGHTFTDAFGNPADGCKQIGFDGDGKFNGKIVLFDKNVLVDCPVVFQVHWSEHQGAVGVIIAETSGNELADVSGTLAGDILIPYIGVRKSEADSLRGNIAVANVTFQNSTTKLIGENQGKLKMYAPAGLEPGSSVSHWSKSTTPDLLMEPALGNLIFKHVDLTPAAFQDIGWSVNIPGGVLDVIFEDSFEN